MHKFSQAYTTKEETKKETMKKELAFKNDKKGYRKYLKICPNKKAFLKKSLFFVNGQNLFTFFFTF
jgi:hypothetical protein